MKLEIASDVVFRIIGEKAVIQNVATRSCFNLDQVGTRMWELISEYRSREDVITVLLTEYEVSEERLRRDLDRLIEQLLASGLLTNEPGEL